MGSALTIDLLPGSNFVLHGMPFIIQGRLSMSHVLARSEDGKLTKRVQVSEILASHNNPPSRKVPALELVDDHRWAEAVNRQAAILKIDQGEDTKLLAESVNITPQHLLVLRHKYEERGLEGLVKHRPSGGVGKSRVGEALEKVLVSAINDEYLTKQKKCVEAVCREVKLRCNSANISPPGRSTVYRRCYAIDEQTKEKKRHGSKSAKDKYGQTFEGYQEATRPLEIIQIDHTLMDIIIVDEETRQPIGRPWLTIIIDVYSRMVIGFYISLDEPSAMSVALCLQQAICPKNSWLEEREIKHEWDIYGPPEAIHMDNGKDFHSKTLRRGCVKHEISMYYRPVGKPEYGAHIERLIGTFMGEMKVLPGATFSDIDEKGTYDAEEESVFTLLELERWFGTLITGKYHKKVHSTLHMSPEQKFLEGLQGSQMVPGAGINRVILDQEDLLMDFTPYFEPTVQNYGIQIDNIRYNSPLLKRYVNAIDKKTKKKRKFLVRRDPRDISFVYFWEPEEQRYIKIPYHNPENPAISLFEYRWALKELKARGKTGPITEQEIFRTYRELKEIEADAVRKTKKARRQSERKKLHRMTTGDQRPTNPPSIPEIDDVPVDEEILPFDEIETTNV